MKIEDNPLGIFKAMTSKKDWIYVTDDQKEKFFFIINRLMSKKYPDRSQLLNDKLINKVTAMDTWYNFMLTQPYPKWFWSKSESSKTKSKTNDDIDNLVIELDLRREDIEILMKYYPKDIKDELKYLKDAQKIK